MIPGPFSYHRPATVADAVKLLSTLGEEARPLAGGHSLVPMMKLRLATPEHLVDLHGIDGLKGIRRDGNRIVIGAMTTQHELLASGEIGKALPILHETALLIADPQVRYMGTIGGNVANGDPGNDMPALMMTLGASYRLEGPAGGPQNRWTGNTSGYEDPRAQRLVDRFRQSMSSEEQLRAVRAISDFVAAELPIMPMYYEAHQIGARRGVKAFDDVKGGAGPGSPYGSYARNAHLWEFR